MIKVLELQGFFWHRAPTLEGLEGPPAIMTIKRVIAYTAAGLSVVALTAGAFLAGSHWGGSGPLGEFTLARWNEDLAVQSEQLSRIERDVDNQVSTLATRVGRMQAQLIRLDALGKQLTDVAQITEAFVRLLRLVPKTGPVLACADFPRVEKALYKASRSAERFGLSQTAEWRPARIRDEGGRTRFDVLFQGHVETELAMRLMGEMNVRNALGVFALCRRLGVDVAAIREAIESFRGVRRRQEVLVSTPVTVIDDWTWQKVFGGDPAIIGQTINLNGTLLVIAGVMPQKFEIDTRNLRQRSGGRRRAGGAAQ